MSKEERYQTVILGGFKPIILNYSKPNVDIPVCVECNVKNYKEVDLKSIEDRVSAIEKSLDRLSNISRSN